MSASPANGAALVLSPHPRGSPPPAVVPEPVTSVTAVSVVVSARVVNAASLRTSKATERSAISATGSERVLCLLLRLPPPPATMVLALLAITIVSSPDPIPAAANARDSPSVLALRGSLPPPTRTTSGARALALTPPCAAPPLLP